MNCCDSNGKCTQGFGCPVRPYLITDEGPADVDTEGGLLLDDYPDWQVISLFVLAALGLFLIAAGIGLSIAVRLYGWPF